MTESRSNTTRKKTKNIEQQAENEFQENILSIDRVARVVKGGRRFGFRATVVVGDGKTRVGVGVARGTDVQIAVSKASNTAKKNLIEVPVVNGTIPHETYAKHSGANVLLKPALPGTGVIAGGVVRNIIDTLGIDNLISKSLGSSNKVNVAYATIKALDDLVPAEEWVTNQNAQKPSRPKKTTTTKKTPAKTKAKATKGAKK